ncbi:MAG: 2-oxoacid:acceptor oxidoreductase family protein [Bacteroidia bacterium]|nr:2-oxoacid:acceptor oxidoreductase family protein [Bacteroidia bacterium]
MQDIIQVGWSVNEAVAVSVAVGHSIAGYDCVVTMKIPGVFQAADAISTSAFFSTDAGALVIYAATDYAPSSTQHVIDSRYFFASSRLPVIEPRNHQEMYEIAWLAADISRKFKTPVIVLASGILAHSEGLVTTKIPGKIEPRALPENLHDWMLMPNIARANYNKATLERIPAIQNWAEASPLITEIKGKTDWGIIVTGESEMILKEALKIIKVEPSILSTAISYPFPKERIRNFASKIKGKLFVIEDGDKFFEEKIRLSGINIIGKDELSVVTDWTPEMIIEFLSKHISVNYHKILKSQISLKPVLRPPTICPGCPYRAFSISASKLKKQRKIYASFGDIGCSTLLYYLKALDTVSCMGASDSIRQGFVMSRPDMAGKVISIIGDSCECHTGLDSTRNAVFRNVPGVKVILDNNITAMTGGQPSPASPLNLSGKATKFSLKKAVEAEGGRTVVINSYNLKEVDNALKKAVDRAEQGEYTTLILEGLCINQTDDKKKIRKIKFNYELCRKCGRCNICPGIEIDDNNMPYFTNLCTFCGSNNPVCIQLCPSDAIIPFDENHIKQVKKTPELPQITAIKKISINKKTLPDSLRVAIRGIGGQGNLFFGKALSEVALRTPYSETTIVKGDTHGMAQLGGPVISTFSCGDVYSPILAHGSADVLVVMEIGEALRPGFLELLKPDGTIIFNNFKAMPVNLKKEEYPSISEIEKSLENYKLIKIDANKIAYDLGDKFGKTANVVVLGLLSTIHPFNAIPEQIWLTALMALSPTGFIKSANKIAFKQGRKIIVNE